MTWNGEDEFKTTFGATVSFFLLALLAVYSVNATIDTVTRASPTVTKNTFRLTPDESSMPFTPQDYGFDFAWGLGATLDPSIGYFTLQHVESIAIANTTQRKKIYEDISFETCGASNFNYSDTDALALYGINAYTCITGANYFLQGDNFYVPDMHYVSLKLRMCQNTTTFSGCKPQSQIDSFFR